MSVTQFGEELIESYRELEGDFAGLAERRLRPITAMLVRRSKSGARVSVRTKLA
jgi:molybdenum-dependent DNA-binding transcriptional regulator ModE